MRFQPLVAAVLLTALVCSGGQSAAMAAAAGMQLSDSGLPPGSIRVEPAVIVDYTGFEQPMGASTLFIPSGWSTKGGVEWGQQHGCVNGYAVNWAATSPDGSMGLYVLPQRGWAANNYGAPPSAGCQAASYTSVRPYLEALVQQSKPGARIVDFRQRLDLAREAGQVQAVTPTPMGEIRKWVDAGEVLFAYTENGRDMRGSIAVVVVFDLTRTNAGSGTMEALNAIAYPAWAATAPNGQMNFAFAEALRKTLKVNPHWQARIGDHNRVMSRNAIEASRKRSQIIADTNAEISRIQQETWNSQQESADRRAREFGELIRGVETYSDADAPGGTVELSNNYDQAWRLNDGSYVLTNDVSFEPYRDLGVEGRRIEAAQ